MIQPRRHLGLLCGAVPTVAVRYSYLLLSTCTAEWLTKLKARTVSETSCPYSKRDNIDELVFEC